MPDSALDILTAGASLTESALRRYRDDLWKTSPPKLAEAIDYSLFAGGKRIRPTLVIEWARACGASESESVLASAAAIELIHTFSLVHDDLPAMDDDDLRRGRPTNHKVYGEAMAILAGDAMTTLAFELIACRADADLVGPLVCELARASGPLGMIGGQVLDIESENARIPLADLQRLHAMKTGALLVAACRLGAIAARADARTIEAATAFGQHMGLAFQIMDDVLDVTSTSEQMGKATNKDEGAGKNTYPQLLGLEESKRLAREQLDAALQSIAFLGAKGDRLATLARFVVERDR
jgi:geranylgeranyl diphosphate synthase type II